MSDTYLIVNTFLTHKFRCIRVNIRKISEKHANIIMQPSSSNHHNRTRKPLSAKNNITANKLLINVLWGINIFTLKHANHIHIALMLN